MASNFLIFAHEKYEYNEKIENIISNSLYYCFYFAYHLKFQALQFDIKTCANIWKIVAHELYSMKRLVKQSKITNDILDFQVV